MSKRVFFLIIVGVFVLNLCSCEQTYQTTTIKVSPSYFRLNAVAQDEHYLNYFEYTLNGTVVLLEPDKTKSAELNIQVQRDYPNLDSLVITSEPVSHAGKIPVHLIEGVILTEQK